MTTASSGRGLCRHDGHTISAHIQTPRRPEIGNCPGFEGMPRAEYLAMRADMKSDARDQALNDESNEGRI